MSDIKQSVERAALLAHCQCRPDRAVERLRAQRDDLLAALEGICDAADSDKGLREHLGGDRLDAARAAIANARSAK